MDTIVNKIVVGVFTDFLTILSVESPPILLNKAPDDIHDLEESTPATTSSTDSE